MESIQILVQASFLVASLLIVVLSYKTQKEIERLKTLEDLAMIDNEQERWSKATDLLGREGLKDETKAEILELREEIIRGY